MQTQKKIGSIDPLYIPEIAHEAKVDVAMVDTAIKDGTNLFNHMKEEQLQAFIKSSHDFGLEAALAGSLRKQHLPLVYSLDADIAGLRGAACTNSDRNKGRLTRELVSELVETVKQSQRV